MAHKPYIIVLRQLGGVGDCLMLSCVARGLKEKYPEHILKYVTAQIYLGGSLLDIGEHNPLWDEIIVEEPFSCTTQRTKEVWQKWFGVGTPNIEDELFWQMADKTFDLNTACVEYEWPALNTPEGIIKPRYQVWCEACDVLPSNYAPIYVVTKEERKIAKDYAKQHWAGKKVIGVGLSACDKKRALGIGKLEEICQGLLKKGLWPVTIDPTCTIPGIDYLVNKRIRELMPLIGEMTACISADSGVLHMSGTIGTPVIGLFGPTNFKCRTDMYKGSFTDSRQLVDCAPCWYKYPCASQNFFPHKPFECLSRIPVSTIIEETLRWVKQN